MQKNDNSKKGREGDCKASLGREKRHADYRSDPQSQARGHEIFRGRRENIRVRGSKMPIMRAKKKKGIHLARKKSDLEESDTEGQRGLTNKRRRSEALCWGRERGESTAPKNKIPTQMLSRSR